MARKPRRSRIPNLLILTPPVFGATPVAVVQLHDAHLRPLLQALQEDLWALAT